MDRLDSRPSMRLLPIAKDSVLVRFRQIIAITGKHYMLIEPYPDNTPLANSPDVPKIEMIDDLIRYLVTVRHRFGNTCVGAYRIRWGSSALWAQDEAQKFMQLTEQLR